MLFDQLMAKYPGKDAVGIRLNKEKPDIVFKRRTTGGVGLWYLSIFPDI